MLGYTKYRRINLGISQTNHKGSAVIVVIFINLKTKPMSTLKEKAQVIMLPAKEKSDIVRNTYCITKEHGNAYHYLPIFHIQDNLIERGFEFQHLYIVSDKKIKEGDWCIQNAFNINNEIKKYNKLLRGNCKKIIATTDLLLGKPTYKQKEGVFSVRLPQPSQRFIKKCIEEYNKGNIITDILVEYETHQECMKTICDDNCSMPSCLNKFKLLKISKNNTIKIHPIKDSWNRREVKKLLEKGMNLSKSKPFSSGEISKWIKENL